MAESVKNTQRTDCIKVLNKLFVASDERAVLIKPYKTLFEKLNEEVNTDLKLASGEISTERNKLKTTSNEALKEISSIREAEHELVSSLDNHFIDVAASVKRLQPLIKEASMIRKCAVHLSVQEKLEKFSGLIQAALISGEVDDAVSHYLQLCEFGKRLSGTHCVNLHKYTESVKAFWYRIIHETLSKNFEKSLEALHWPDIVSNAIVPEAKEKMLEALHILLRMEQTNRDDEGGKVYGAIQIMLKPLVKKFYYHFCGNKQTNSLEKPEWYLTQCLVWIKDAQHLLRDDIQQLFVKVGIRDTTPLKEYIAGLLNVIKKKAEADLNELLNNDALFCHFIDEVLLFDQELQQTYSLSSSSSTDRLSIVHILLQDSCFDKWLAMEHKIAQEKMDAMLSSPTAWDCYPMNSADCSKVPECGENFVMMLQAVTERYRNLPSLKHKRRFVRLQLELIDDFRIRLVQLFQTQVKFTLNVNITAKLNAISYLSNVLREWSQLPFFAQFELTASTESENNNIEVFGESVALLGRIIDRSIKDIVDNVMKEICLAAYDYKNNRWENILFTSDQSVSPTACGWLSIVRSALHEAQQLLCANVFDMFWKLLASHLNGYLYKHVIMGNRFGEGGAAQLSYDINQMLLALFSEFTSRPDSYLRDVKDACTVLSLNAGALLLLRDVFRQALHGDDVGVSQSVIDPVSVLAEIGVHKLDLDEVEELLKKRIVSSA